MSEDPREVAPGRPDEEVASAGGAAGVDGAPEDLGTTGETEGAPRHGPGDAPDAPGRAAGSSDGPGGAAGDAPSPEALEEREAETELAAEMDRLQQEFGSLNDRHLRLAAEFSNYRRRAETESRETWTRAQADLVRRFLDVLDDLQRVSALDAGNTTVEALVEGVDLVERKFVRALEEAGVEVLEPEGEPFDPETMEAMLRVAAESEADDDRVAQVFQRGYRLRGHLVRPARVSVLKHE